MKVNDFVAYCTSEVDEWWRKLSDDQRMKLMDCGVKEADNIWDGWSLGNKVDFYRMWWWDAEA